ncbi:MAG: cation:proton antiporter [Aquabacterium sp.]|uniref:cation:proton antiporter n=1 Tax=Aquabacterium sp. TaxID=1872578 RepID=UPI0025BCA8CF|nr:cation:proton antiporter [Aquabacterium sp.]MBI5924683.1 cation:proton antiporter [Aquabacterium sp.]
MPHDVSLISTIAAGFGLALLLGLGASWLRMPPLVGYLVAGVLIGPGTPGFVADVGLAGQLAEIGVMLLMFGVGLHFSMSDLMAVKRIAIPGALVQIAAAVAMGMGAASWWGWSVGAALVFGLCLSVASTVVLLKALEARGQLDTVNGRIAVGWLIVEDLVMVLVLVLLPAFASLLPQSNTPTSTQPLWLSVSLTLAKVVAFVATMLVLGRRLLPRMLWWVARSGSRELFTLCVVAVAVGVAFGAAKLFDVSFALGAFFAGMMMRESEFSHRAAAESLPLRDAFAVLFFVSVGMLFDPSILWQSPGKLLLTATIILLGKTVAAIALVLLFRYPLNTALTVGAGLAQIGEFSFILAGLGSALGLLPQEGRDLILAGALVSIAANSALFAALDPLLGWLQTRSSLAQSLASRDDPLAQLPNTVDPAHLTGQVVLVGYGALGQGVATLLDTANVRYVVAEENRAIVERLRQNQVPAVSGDLADPATLIQAHIARAKALVITTGDSILTQQLIDMARQLNESAAIYLVAHNQSEASLLLNQPGLTVITPDSAMAEVLTKHTLAHLSAQ